ncbi:MAG: hypothetical protein WCF88_04690 [Candidatus Acidiferrales bacterium]
MCEDLEALRYACGEFAAALDFAKMVIADGAFCERRGEFVRGGDRILNREIDSDSTDWRHGMRGIADAEKPGARPLAQAVHGDGKQLDVVPIF